MNAMEHGKHDFHKIVEVYFPKVIILSRRMISCEETAKDAAQESWYHIIKGIENFRGESSIGTWIYSVARRTIARYAKNEREYTKRMVESYLLMFEQTFPEGSEKDQRVKDQCYDCLTAFMHCLNNDDRLIMIFREMIDLSLSEISMIMEIEKESVRKRLFRSKKKIRSFLEEHCILYNPEGTCRCKMKKQVQSISLDDAFKKIDKTARLIRFFENAEKVLPKKQFWIKSILEV